MLCVSILLECICLISLLFIESNFDWTRVSSFIVSSSKLEGFVLKKVLYLRCDFYLITMVFAV